MGRAGRPRPSGPLVWLHGASVGEANSALPLIAALQARLPAAHVLLTTGTVTSARLMAQRLPARAIHQFAPVDAAPWVARFLDHWRPDLALWLESELWPNLVAATAARGVPMALVNARMSERSFARWRRRPGFARALIGAFGLVLAQSDRDAAHYSALGAANVSAAGNLKYAAAPPPADEAAVREFAAAIGDRPAWLAASVHPEEAEAIAAAHRALRERFPALLTVVVPRHPEKAPAFLAAWNAAGPIRAQRRSQRADLAPTTELYFADTLGELGLFYRALPVVFVGKSLGAVGGQNPIEPAQLGRALVFGPGMENFADSAGALLRSGAAREVQDASGLAAAVSALLADPGAARASGAAARRVAEAEAGALARILDALAPLLAPLERRGHAAA
jgi:3-deoxy-D-manno-octulosonic-acid transferase